MNVAEAKSQVINLIQSSLDIETFQNIIDIESPDPSDAGKFTLLNLPARVIHRFNGWNIPINRKWFMGGLDLPKINNIEFNWYVFAIPQLSGFKKKHYYICDYLQLHDFVMDFKAPMGLDHKDDRYWRADIQLVENKSDETLGYFRWGDEPNGIQDKPSRIIRLDNVLDLLQSKSSESSISRVSYEISRVIRDSRVIRNLKALYKNKCQICGITIGDPEHGYSEGHHLIPLGNPHNGPDIEENIIILCPNHHTEFDYGFIAVDAKTLRVIHRYPYNQYNGNILNISENHTIARISLEYHQEKIFNK